MADENYHKILRQGVDVWNMWRDENPDVKPNLSDADLGRANLSGADFSHANLSGADLSHAYLQKARFSCANLYKANLGGADLDNAHFFRANLNFANLNETSLICSDFYDANLSAAEIRNANLTRADLTDAKLYHANLEQANLFEATLRNTNMARASLFKANLGEADLFRADLTEARLIRARLNGAIFREAYLLGADLQWADLSNACFKEAKLNGANLKNALLVETDFENANLSDCSVFGASVWKINLKETVQSNLIISDENEPSITVDNLEAAQFIYLLLSNKKIRDVIDTITSKVVLILGRFTPERKNVLDAIREELRNRNYLPLLFDFQKPSSRDITETISILAHMARFIIADITDAKSIPQELQAIVPNLPSVAVLPLLQTSKDEYGMFEHFKRYPWVLSLHRYNGIDDLITKLGNNVITQLENKVNELIHR